MTRMKENASIGRLGGEFVLIVVGVLMALMVDAWIEERRDEATKQQYLGRLASDLQVDLENLDHRLVFFAGVRDKGLQTLRALRSEAAVTTDDVLAAFHAAERFDFAPVDGTYQDLLSTGNIRLLDDMELRLALSTYYGQQNVRGGQDSAYRRAVRGIIPAVVQTQVRQLCPTTDAADRIPTGFPPCEIPGFSNADAEAVYERLRIHAGLDEILTYRLSELETMVFLLGVQKKRLLTTLDFITGG